MYIYLFPSNSHSPRVFFFFSVFCLLFIAMHFNICKIKVNGYAVSPLLRKQEVVPSSVYFHHHQRLSQREKCLSVYTLNSEFLKWSRLFLYLLPVNFCGCLKNKLHLTKQRFRPWSDRSFRSCVIKICTFKNTLEDMDDKTSKTGYFM